MAQWLKYILWILALVLLGSVPLAMQFDASSIQGGVSDDLGPIAGASVEIHNVIARVAERVQTDHLGNYKFEAQQPGRYSLWVQAIGHDSVSIPEVIVIRGQVTRQDVHLRRVSIPTGL